MATTLDNQAIREAAMALSVEQYHRMGEAGVLTEDTELLRGTVVKKMVKFPLHTLTVQRLVDRLRAGVGPGHHVRQEQPLTLADSEPEPDVAVVAGPVDAFRDRHPATARWVIEVAAGAAGLDREKAGIYAEAGVDEYWLVRPREQTVEVFVDRGPDGYRTHRVLHGGDGLRSAAFPELELDPADLFR